jgi:hypothetical protein
METDPDFFKEFSVSKSGGGGPAASDAQAKVQPATAAAA